MTGNPSGDVVTQSVARAHAREWNDQHPAGPFVAIADRVPAGSWGGEEIGWTIRFVVRPSM